MKGYDGTGLPLNRNCQVYTAPAQKLEMALTARENSENTWHKLEPAGSTTPTYIRRLRHAFYVHISYIIKGINQNLRSARLGKISQHSQPVGTNASLTSER